MLTIRTKQEAIRLFGGTLRAVGDALGISRQAVCQWPEILSQDTSDRLLGAAIRLQLIKPTLAPVEPKPSADRSTLSRPGDLERKRAS